MTNGNDHIEGESRFLHSRDGDNGFRLYEEVKNTPLTKREWMATMVIQGILAINFGQQLPDAIAKEAIEHADALIAALNRPMCPDCKTRFADDGHYDAENKICPDYERAWSERPWTG